MKKYLLTGGFAAMLLLGACGTPEEAVETVQEEVTEDEEVEADTVEESTEEESTEQVADDEVGESTDTVEDEEPGTLDEANEEVAGENGITEIYGYNDEVVTEEVDTLNVTRDSVVVMGAEVDSESSWYFADEGYEIGDEVQMIAIEYTVENTVEEQRDFYLDQTTIITSTGEQIESEWLMESGLQSEMLGAVKSSGQIVFLLRNDGAEDIEWIDVIIPSVSDADWNSLTEEYKQRIEIKSE